MWERDPAISCGRWLQELFPARITLGRLCSNSSNLPCLLELDQGCAWQHGRTDPQPQQAAPPRTELLISFLLSNQKPALSRRIYDIYQLILASNIMCSVPARAPTEKRNIHILASSDEPFPKVDACALSSSYFPASVKDITAESVSLSALVVYISTRPGKQTMSSLVSSKSTDQPTVTSLATCVETNNQLPAPGTGAGPKR